MMNVRQPVRPAHGRLALVLMSLLALLPSCTNYVEVLQDRVLPQPVTAATVMPQQHALAILGIDFDPPLHSPQVLPLDGVSLLVAVENQGLAQQQNVSVVARLLRIVDDVTTEMLSETVREAALPAGEVRIVRFTQVSTPPEPRGHYRLVVELDAVEGETNLSDNRLVYDIVFRAASD